MNSASENSALLDQGRAEETAESLCLNSATWARTIRATVGCPSLQLEEALFVEVLAYSFSLLKLRLSHLPQSEREVFLASVRIACARIGDARISKRLNRRKGLRAPGSEAANQTHSRISSLLDQSDEAARLTPEMFEQFCQLTGLESSVLVGEGENLASLIFYITVHGVVVSLRGPLSAGQGLKLLRVLRECRKCLSSSCLEAGRSTRPMLRLRAPPILCGGI